MTLHRDHIVGAVLLVGAVITFALSGDLPVGTLGSPGPGMVPMLAIALICVFSVALIAAAHSSPVAGEITWLDLPHAAAVIVACVLAALTYERLGFVLTMTALITGVLVFIERIALWRAALFGALAVAALNTLLAKLLKSPLPIGPFGF